MVSSANTVDMEALESTSVMHELIGLANTTTTLRNSFLMDRSNSTKITPDDKDLIIYYNNMQTYIWTYVPPIIMTIGVISNLLSLAVWVRSLVNKRGSSSSYFFACLSVADIIVLLFVPMDGHIGHVYYNGINPRRFSDFACKFYYFMMGFSLSFTSYLLASLSLFRLVGILCPHRYKQICNSRNAKRIILFILAFSILAHAHFLIGFKLTNLEKKLPDCKYETSWNFIRLFFTFWSMVVTYFLPMVIIVFANVAIICKLFRKRALSIGTTNTSNGDHAFSRIVIILIVISMVYFFTMSPLSVYIIFRGNKDLAAMSRVSLLRDRLGWTITSNISLLNSTLNFWTYCITHPQFLTELKDCFQVFKGWLSSTFLICWERKAVRKVTKVQIELGSAGPSGLQARYPTLNNKTASTIMTLEDTVKGVANTEITTLSE